MSGANELWRAYRASLTPAPPALLLVALTSLVLIATAVSPPSAAALNCDSEGIYHRFDGIYQTSGNIVADRGTLTDRAVQLCDNGSGGEAAAGAWVLIRGGPAKYAQVGYMRLGTWSGAKAFTEYLKNSNSNYVRTTDGDAFNLGTERDDEVIYSGSAMWMFGEGIVANTNFDPGTEWPGDWTWQFFGETLNRNTDMPGTPTNKAVFKNLEKLGCGSCSWLSLNNVQNVVDTPGIYEFDWVNFPHQFRIWTDR